MRATDSLFRSLFIVCLVILGVPLAIFPAPIPIDNYGPPEAQFDFDGNSFLHPFEIGPTRYQQVYNSSVFTPLTASGGGWISYLRFRVDSFEGAVASRVESMQISMSTTARASDGLSAVFSENTGLDDQIALGPRSVGLFSLGSGAFDMYITLDVPFFYDPTLGNLLLDFQIFKGIVPEEFPQPGPKAVLDAFNVVGDSVSSVYGDDASGINMPTTGQPSSLGIATGFIITPVPEPTMLALLTLSLVFLGGRSWKRIRKG